MAEITVSDSLYSQLKQAADEEDIEHAMWEMIYLFQQRNDPAE